MAYVWTSNLAFRAILGIAIVGIPARISCSSDGGALEAGIRAFRDRNWAEAERQFRRETSAAAASGNKAVAAAWKWLGMTYAAQDRLSEAREPFETACRLAPRDPDSCYYLGRALLGLARFDEAANVLRDVLRREPRSGRVHAALALAEMNRGNREEAKKRFEQAIALGDANARADYERFRVESAAAGAGSAAPPPFHFEIQNLPFTLRNGAAGRYRLPETMTGGLAIADFDGDGLLDLFFANLAGPNAMLRGRPGGRFEPDSRADFGDGGSMGASAADFDGDGDIDLCVTGVSRLRLFENLGSEGRFREIAADAGLNAEPGWTTAAAWFDYDRDGWLDLFVARYVQWDPAREPDCSSGGNERSIRQYCHPRQYAPLGNLLYRNLGKGKGFRDVSRESGIAAQEGKAMGVAIGDVDEDGWPDVFVANDQVPSFLFRNRRDGTFAEAGFEWGVALPENSGGAAISAMGAGFRDVDGDGHDDLFVTALSNESYPLYRSLLPKQRRFEDATGRSGLARATLPYTGWGLATADLDNDGRPDLVAANGHVMDNAEAVSGRASRQPNLLLWNRTREAGKPLFQSVPLPGGAAFHRGLVAADLDGDGRLDLVVTRLNEPARILWNRTQRVGAWLAVEIRGGGDDVVEAAGQRIRVETSRGYASSGPAEVWFGLGDRTAVIPEVRVVWRGGGTRVLSGVRVNQRIVIER